MDGSRNLTWVQGTFVLRFELKWYLTKTWRFSRSPGLSIFSPLIFAEWDYYVQHTVDLTLGLSPQLLSSTCTHYMIFVYTFFTVDSPSTLGRDAMEGVQELSV